MYWSMLIVSPLAIIFKKAMFICVNRYIHHSTILIYLILILFTDEMPLIYATFENEWSDWMNEWQEAYLPSLSSFWHPHTLPSSLLLGKCQMSCKGSEFTIGRWHGPPKMSSDGPYHLLGKIVKYVLGLNGWVNTYESWHPDTRHKHVNLAFKNADWLLMLLQ